MTAALAIALFAGAAAQEADVNLGHDLEGSASASSVLVEKGQAKDRYGPARAFDGDLTTAWAEGAKGPGEGAWVELRLNGPRDFNGIAFVPGHGKSDALYRANNRLAAFTLMVERSDGDEAEVQVELPAEPPFGAWVLVPYSEHARAFKLTVRSVFKGKKYDDTCVAELRPVLADLPSPERTALDLLGKLSKPGELLPLFPKDGGARVRWSLEYAQKDRKPEKADGTFARGKPGPGWDAVSARLEEDGGFAASEGGAWLTVAGTRAHLELVGPAGAASLTRMTAELERRGEEWVVAEIEGITKAQGSF